MNAGHCPAVRLSLRKSIFTRTIADTLGGGVPGGYTWGINPLADHVILRTVVGYTLLNRNLIIKDRPPVIHPATLSMATAKFAYSVHGCAGMAGTKYILRRHFRFLHPQDLVNVPDKGCYLGHDCCGMWVNPTAMGHQGTKACKHVQAVKL